jgi:hypothetical protein
VRLFVFARKAMGASCTRHSLRPLFEEGNKLQSSDAKSRREDANVWQFVVASEGSWAPRNGDLVAV